MAHLVETKSMKVEMKGDGVAVVRLDQEGAKVNSLNQIFMDDFNTVFEKLNNDSNVKSIVLISGKKGNFIAGADINMLAACKTEEEAANLARNGHKIFFNMEKR